LVATPAADQFGTASIAVTVNDSAGGFATNTFVLTVNPVNDPPTLNPISDVITNEDSGPVLVNLAGITAGATNETDTLSLTATSSKPALVPTPVVNYSSPNTAGSLNFTPNPATNGVAVITVTVNDGQPSNNIVTRTFTVAVNAAPIISTIANQTTD